MYTRGRRWRADEAPAYPLPGRRGAHGGRGPRALGKRFLDRVKVTLPPFTKSPLLANHPRIRRLIQGRTLLRFSRDRTTGGKLGGARGQDSGATRRTGTGKYNVPGRDMGDTATIDAAPQHLKALEQANRVRLARAELKRQVASQETTAAEVVLECPWEAASMELSDLLMSQRRWGRARCRRLLLSLGLPENKHIGTLTPRQRRALVDVLSTRMRPDERRVREEALVTA